MNIPKLAALGAVGVSLALCVVYLGFVWLTYPRYTAGISWTHAEVAWIAVGCIFAMLIAVHLVYARVLWDSARGVDNESPSRIRG